MQRRSFVRSSLAAALFAPGALSLPELAEARVTRRRYAADPIRLSSNENPLGMPEAARKAIIDAIAPLGNRYPSLNGTVVSRLAQWLKVQPNQVVLGNGSAEILQMVVQAMSVGGRVRVVIPDPTFEQVERYALAMGADVVKVPLLADHTHDLERMKREASTSSGPVLVFVCNPNNPTGTLTPSKPIADWIGSAPNNMWFLVDEAYFEFVDDASYRTFIPDAIAKPNVVVSRTFSKIFGLAGVRLGYGVASSETIQKVDRFAAGTNINAFALAAGLACMEDDGTFMKRSLQVNAQGRDFAYRTLKDLKLEYLPTHANFVMHRINGDLNDYINRMREAGVIVGRRFPPMLTYNRVSIGLPEEMKIWAGALQKLRADGAL